MWIWKRYKWGSVTQNNDVAGWKQQPSLIYTVMASQRKWLCHVLRGNLLQTAGLKVGMLENELKKMQNNNAWSNNVRRKQRNQLQRTKPRKSAVINSRSHQRLQRTKDEEKLESLTRHETSSTVRLCLRFVALCCILRKPSGFLDP